MIVSTSSQSLAWQITQGPITLYEQFPKNVTQETDYESIEELFLEPNQQYTFNIQSTWNPSSHPYRSKKTVPSLTVDGIEDIWFGDDVHHGLAGSRFSIYALIGTEMVLLLEGFDYTTPTVSKSFHVTIGDDINSIASNPTESPTSTLSNCFTVLGYEVCL